MTRQWMQHLPAGLLAVTVLLLPWHARADFLTTTRQEAPPTFDSTTDQWSYAYRATPAVGSEMTVNGAGTPMTNVATFVIRSAIADDQAGSVELDSHAIILSFHPIPPALFSGNRAARTAPV
jgi:hypothetical protein